MLGCRNVEREHPLHQLLALEADPAPSPLAQDADGIGGIRTSARLGPEKIYTVPLVRDADGSRLFHDREAGMLDRRVSVMLQCSFFLLAASFTGLARGEPHPLDGEGTTEPSSSEHADGTPAGIDPDPIPEPHGRVVVPNGPATPAPAPAPASTAMAGWITIGAGLVVTAAGTGLLYLGYSGLKEQHDAMANPSRAGRLPPDSNHQEYSAAGVIACGLGVTAIAIGIVLIAVAPRKQARAGVLAIGADGLAVGAHF